MLDTFFSENKDDENGMPSGGWVKGVGMEIHWQDGPLGRGEDRKPPNGAFVETVIAAARQRLEYYQKAANGRFWCGENAAAILELTQALEWLSKRTTQREVREVEGTHLR